MCFSRVIVLSMGPYSCHLVGQPLFKYQDDARSNTHSFSYFSLLVILFTHFILDIKKHAVSN